jgi:uncharacterized protein with PQ loop repeat
VGSILTKLGLSSRAAPTAHAHQHDLVWRAYTESPMPGWRRVGRFFRRADAGCSRSVVITGPDRKREAAMDMGLPVVAGTISTAIFAVSTLPMLLKAAHTKDLSSYSLGNIVLSNLGNLIHSVYVFHLPAGPAWVLHSFYLVTTALMLFWYLRYAARRDRRQPQRPRQPAPQRPRHSHVGM